MSTLLIKILLRNSKKYIFFVFLSLFLSLFSYIFSTNIVLSVESYIAKQIRPVLGGDVVIYSDEEINLQSIESLYPGVFKISKTIETTSTVFAGERPIFTNIFFVDEAFPIYQNYSSQTINEDGTLIVSQEIATRFDEEIEIFGNIYQIKGVLDETPFSDFNFGGTLNSVYLPYEEIDNSGLSRETSRLEYETFLQFIGTYDRGVVEALKNNPNFENTRIRSLEDRNENFGEITDRFGLFLYVFTLLIFVLTFFIIILSLEIYFKRLRADIGLLVTLGLKKYTIYLTSFIALGIIFICAFIGAVGLNVLAIEYLQTSYDFFMVYNESLIRGLFAGIIILIAGLIGPLYKIAKSDIKSLIIESSDFTRFTISDVILYIMILWGGFVSLSITSGLEIRFALLYASSTIVFIIILYFLISIILRCLFAGVKKLFSPSRSFYIFDAFRSTVAPGNVSFFMFFSSFISFFSIFLFFVFSGSFLQFLTSVTENSNDTYVINISEQDSELARETYGSKNVFEVSSARIESINTLPLGQYNSSREYSREFFVATNILSDEIISGETLSSGTVSIDSEFAQEFGLSLGDVITFNIAGIKRSLEVINFRETTRGGIDPYFIFAVYPPDFESLPKRYFASYNSENFPENIGQVFASQISSPVTFIDTKAILDIVIDVARQVLLVVYLCLGYLGVFTFLTFITSVSFLQGFKQKKLSLLHTLGSPNGKLIFSIIYEYMYLIALGALFGIVITTLCLLLLTTYVDFFTLDMMSYREGLVLCLGIYIFIGIYVIISQKLSFSSSSR